MNEERTELAQRCTELAYLSLALSGEEPSPLALARRSLAVRRALGEHSLAMEVHAALPINATITRIDLEASSQRYLVEFLADNNENGVVETIRTDRLDGARGDIVRRLWTPSLAGHRARIYKLNSPARPGADGKAREYRRAVFVEDLGVVANPAPEPPTRPYPVPRFEEVPR